MSYFVSVVHSSRSPPPSRSHPKDQTTKNTEGRKGRSPDRRRRGSEERSPRRRAGDGVRVHRFINSSRFPLCYPNLHPPEIPPSPLSVSVLLDFVLDPEVRWLKEMRFRVTFRVEMFCTFSPENSILKIQSNMKGSFPAWVISSCLFTFSMDGFRVFSHLIVQ